jgi:BASS family bile acid:Na+ symporter
MSLLKKLRAYMMPIAMTVGATFHHFFGALSYLTPYMIFAMLLLTYCNMDMKQVRFSPSHFWLLCIQLVGSVALYLLLRPFSELVAQGVMVCVLVPTGTAAAVVTGMLGGSVESVTAYSLLCNFAVALAAPILFSFIGNNTAMPFWESVWMVTQHVGLILIVPFVLAFIFTRFVPKVGKTIGSYSPFAFYIWTLGLTIVTGRTVEFVISQNSSQRWIEIALAIGALLVCLAQFLSGRRIGSKYHDTVAGGQGLGQKNTILAIWMAQLYLSPIASIAPGSYVLWQNLVNSYQVWRKRNQLG